MKTIEEIEKKLDKIQKEVEQLKTKEILYEHTDKFVNFYNTCHFTFKHGTIYYGNGFIVSSGCPVRDAYDKIICKKFIDIEIGEWYINEPEDYMPVLAISKDTGIYYNPHKDRIAFTVLADEALKYKLKFE